MVAGREGTQTLLRDARRGTAASPLLAGDAARPGASLHLTLDAAIQHVAEQELAARGGELRRDAAAARWCSIRAPAPCSPSPRRR